MPTLSADRFRLIEFVTDAEIERSGNPRDVLNRWVRMSNIYTVSHTLRCKSFHGLTAFLDVVDTPQAGAPTLLNDRGLTSLWLVR